MTPVARRAPKRAPWTRLALALFACWPSCASTARVTGDFGDYQSYRRTRLATTLEERLAASDRYLRDYPHGSYRPQVQGGFALAEAHYFKLSYDNLPRLRAYLDALPRGPHAAAVGERISELESRRVFAERRDRRLLDTAQSLEASFAAAAEQRREFVREFSALTRLLGATRSFGKPLAELAPEFRERLELASPSGPCASTGEVCAKAITFSYAVPDDNRLVQRRLDVSVQLTLARGTLRAVSVSAPGLFTRVAEAVVVRAAPEDSLQGRAEALAQAVDVIDSALSDALPKARCAADAISPVILERRCDGVILQAVAGAGPAEPDRVWLLAAKAH